MTGSTGNLIFRGLSVGQAEKLLRSGYRVQHTAGETVVGQGEPARSLMIILEGVVEIVRSSVDGDRLVGQLGPGAVFGGLGLLAPERTHPVTMRAVEPCDLIVLPADLSDLWQQQGSGVAFPLLCNVAWFVADMIAGQDARRVMMTAAQRNYQQAAYYVNQGGHLIGDMLGPERSGQLAALMAVHRYRAGDFIFRQGQPADRFGFIVEGEVEILREAQTDDQDDSEQEQEPICINTSSPGALVGELGFLAGCPRTASVRALTPVIMNEMDESQWRALVDEQPQLARAFLVAVLRYLVGYLTCLYDVQGRNAEHSDAEPPAAGR